MRHCSIHTDEYTKDGGCQTLHIEVNNNFSVWNGHPSSDIDVEHLIMKPKTLPQMLIHAFHWPIKTQDQQWQDIKLNMPRVHLSIWISQQVS